MLTLAIYIKRNKVLFNIFKENILILCRNYY